MGMVQLEPQPQVVIEESERAKLVRAVPASLEGVLVQEARTVLVSSEGALVREARAVPMSSEGVLVREARAVPERSQPTTRRVAPSIPCQPLVDYSSLSSISGQIAEKVASEVKTEVRQEIHPVLELVASTQERNKAYFEELLVRQLRLEGDIRTIYLKGIQMEGKIFPRIWLELERGRKERAEIAAIVKSLRLWARSMQRSLPSDANLRAAVEMLAQPEDQISLYQYIEANLPLIPGIIHYKVEIGSEHKAELLGLWREIKRRWGGQ